VYTFMYSKSYLYFGCSQNHGNYLMAKNMAPQEMKNIRLKAHGKYL